MLGQQVSVAGARTIAGRLAARFGERLPGDLRVFGDGGPDRLFPTPAALLSASDPDLPMPNSRRIAIRALSHELAAGTLALSPGVDPRPTEAALVGLPGIGPWTAAYIRLRALADGDAFLPTDLGVRRALEALGRSGLAADAEVIAERWRPWRAYGLMYLWLAS